MTDHEILLAAVVASPDDDGPRLAIADYFEETGDGDRAKLIRTSVELAKRCTPKQLDNIDCIDMFLDPDDSEQQDWKREVVKLRKTELRLLTPENVSRWTGFEHDTKRPVNRLGVRVFSTFGNPFTRVIRWEWRRGFIDRLTLGWEVFLGHHSHFLWKPGETPPVNYKGASEEFERPIPLTCQPIRLIQIDSMPATGVVRHLIMDSNAFPISFRGERVLFERMKCEECDGTGMHLYGRFLDGSPNYSDSLPCRGCKGRGRTGQWVTDRWSPVFVFKPQIG